LIYGLVVFFKSRRNRGVYKSVDPLLQQPSAYSAAAPGNVELESQRMNGAAAQSYYGPQQTGVYEQQQKDPRFEAYRQSVPPVSVPGYGGSPQPPQYGQTYAPQEYDTTPQVHHQGQHQGQTGYVS
jgi:hypothetical protein